MYAKIMSLNYSSCNAIFYGHPLQDTKADHWTLKKKQVLFSFLARECDCSNHFILFLLFTFYPKLVDPLFSLFWKNLQNVSCFPTSHWHLYFKVIPSGFHILFYKVNIFTLLKSFSDRETLFYNLLLSKGPIFYIFKT